MRTEATAIRLPAGELLTELGMSVDPELLDRALTHRSYAYEQGGLPTNERLEFLGDSVLALVVTEHLFVTYPDLSEGQLAKLRAAVVNSRALADVARQLDYFPLNIPTDPDVIRAVERAGGTVDEHGVTLGQASHGFPDLFLRKSAHREELFLQSVELVRQIGRVDEDRLAAGTERHGIGLPEGACDQQGVLSEGNRPQTGARRPSAACPRRGRCGPRRQASCPRPPRRAG